MLDAPCRPDDHQEIGTQGGWRVEVAKVQQDEVVQSDVVGQEFEDRLKDRRGVRGEWWNFLPGEEW